MKKSGMGGPSSGSGAAPGPQLQSPPPPSLFDLFYEELLTQLMKSGELEDKVPQEFMQLQTDIERVEYLMMLRPVVSAFEIRMKMGTKCLDKSTKYREEGNKLFQAEQTAQAILFYNKSISYAPHPNHEEYTWPSPSDQDKQPDQQNSKKKPKSGAAVAPSTTTSPAAKFEALALCYANRSAALRKLCQYEDCLRDIARAARFGYPKENMYKLWERKAKCYQGLKRYELAAKCLKKAITCIKDAAFTENQKAKKVNEYQGLLKEWRSAFFLAQMGGPMPISESELEHIFSPESPSDSSEAPPQLMGATGPMVFVPETSRKKSTTTTPPQTAALKVERKSFFHRKSSTSSAPPTTPLSSSPPQSASPPPPSQPPPLPNGGDDAISIGSAHGAGGGELHKANSQMSITQLSSSNSNHKLDGDVPELSFGANSRMPSASSAIELRFSPDKGRFFVANQDLVPGDVILREEPYAAVLDPIFRVNHCSNCLRKTPTPIPCYECATVQYCCETCRDAAWIQYHHIECGILAYLETSRYLGKMPHLALRIVTKTGMQNLLQHSISQGGASAKGDPAATVSMPGISVSGVGAPYSTFDPTSYKSVHNLATNTDKRSFEDLLKKTAEAIFMSKCLKFTGFFGEKPDGRAELFIASLLLRHLQIAATNGLEMAECILKNNDITKFDIIPIGGAIFPTMSFFNHSCYPNALRLGYQSFQVVRVIRTIRRGEEVNIDYGFDFYANPMEKRQYRASSQYHFTCRCVACLNNWPVYNELVGRRSVLKVAPSNDIIDEMNRQAISYQAAMESLIKLDVANSMPLFRHYLIVMNELIEHPDQHYIDCEEAYKQCLWIENKGFKPKHQEATAAAALSAAWAAAGGMSFNLNALSKVMATNTAVVGPMSR